jgi:hypothetical protein
MDFKDIKPADDYAGLLIQFKAMRVLLGSKEAQLEYYQKRVKEFSVERIIQLEAELESEKEMNAILTKELDGSIQSS